MTNIENYLSLAHRKGFDKVPLDFNMCASLQKKFADYVERTSLEYAFSHGNLPDLTPKTASEETLRSFYDHGFKPGTEIDIYGVAHEPGSEAAFHMTRMYHPMERFVSVE